MRKLVLIPLFLCALAFPARSQTITPQGSGASVVNPSTNGAAYWDGVELTTTPTGGAGTLCLTSASGGVPAWSSCAGSASTAWSALSNPSGNMAINVGVNLTQWTINGNTGTTNLFSIIDTTGNTGTGSLFEIHTVGTSSAKPFTATAKGTANGVQMDNTGSLAAIGTGTIVFTSGPTTGLTGTITNAQLAGSITAAKLVGTDIATVGTITSGTWHSTVIGSLYGGTGGDSSGSTGLAHVTAGTWSYSTVATADIAANAVTLAKLGVQAADTVLTNATGGVAVPSAVAWPTTGTNGCAGASNAIGYNTTTHAFVCNTISAGGLTVGSTSITSGTTTRILFDNAGTLGEYVITGTGNVAMSASPTFTGTITGAAETLSGALTNNGSYAGSAIVPAAQGGSGVANTATHTLGSSNQNWASLGTGIVKNTTTTGAISDAVAADVYGLFSGTHNSANCLAGDGTMQPCSGGGGSANPPFFASTTSTVITMAAGACGTLANGYTQLAGTYTVTHSAGTDTGTISVGCNQSNQVVAYAGASGITAGNYTVVGFLGSTLQSGNPPQGTYTTAITVTAGVFSAAPTQNPIITLPTIVTAGGGISVASGSVVSFLLPLSNAAATNTISGTSLSGSAGATVCDDGSGGVKDTSCSGGSGYSTIDSNGSAITQRAIVNFISGTNATVACVDNSGATRSDCTISASSSAGSRLDQITAATGANTINNANNPQIWNFAQTSNNQVGFKLSENTASTGGTGTSQALFEAITSAGSTAIPGVFANSLSGSQTLSTLYIFPTWNTSGVVDAALLMNVTNTASGTGSLLADFQVGGVSQFKVDKAGNLTVNGCTGCGSGSNAFSALTSGTNTTMAGLIGTGASLGVTGAGTIAATSAPLSGISGLGTNVGTFLGTPSSANLASAVTDETGTSLLVFNTSALLVTPKVTTINDANANPFIASSATASAVDSITVTNAATANPATVQIAGTGSDTNINLKLIAKGTGALQLNSTAAFVDNAGNLTVNNCTGCGSGTGTVTHTGSLTANACVVGNGTADIKTPNSVCTVDASGNMGVQTLNAVAGVQIGFENGPGPLSVVYMNNTSTGTTNGKVVRLDGTAFEVVNVSGSDTDALGICSDIACGTSGGAQISIGGTANCVFDNTAAVGDFVQYTAATADCHDTGSSTFPISGTKVIGRAISAGTGTQIVAVNVQPVIPPGTVTSVTCGTGLSGGAITTSGTCSITAPVTVALGGTNATSAGITAFNNITGYTASGATGTTSTNIVFSASPTLTGTITAAAYTGSGAFTNNGSYAGSAIVPVPQGGIGVGTLAAHGPLIGEGTSAVAASSPGTTGQCYLSNGASTDPSFQACPGGAGAGNSVTSVTPVTVNTNTTSDQQLMELSLGAGYFNSSKQPFLFDGAGLYTTQTAQTPTITLKIKLCTISGCGSGTVVTLISIVSTATIAAVTNNNWNLSVLGYTATTGATGNLEIHGPLAVDLGALTTTADSIFVDTNTAVSSNIDLTAALFVDFTISFSTNAVTANTFTQRSGGVMPFAATAAPVTSFSGDGTLISNSLSTGAVTATLATAAAHKFWMNNTGSTAAPGYQSAALSDLPGTVVNATSPGVGLAHFAGSTQTVTSSLIVAADITSATITGTQIASSIALAGSPTTTSQTVCDNSTKVATTAYVSAACNVVETSGSPLAATAQSQTIWNNTAGAYVVDLPATASGLQLCVGNYKTVAHAVSFVPPSGSTIYYKGVAGTTSSATGIVSGGAAGDFICVEAVDSTTWLAIGAGQGTFTNN